MRKRESWWTVAKIVAKIKVEVMGRGVLQGRLFGGLLLLGLLSLGLGERAAVDAQATRPARSGSDWAEGGVVLYKIYC